MPVRFFPSRLFDLFGVGFLGKGYDASDNLPKAFFELGFRGVLPVP